MPGGSGARVDVRGLTWRPLGRRTPVLDALDLAVEPGQRVLLAGPSGSGKSTLLRALAGLLLTAEVGDLSGEVLVDGSPPESTPGRVALLLQDPTAATVADRVGRDVAFGPENLRLERPRIWERVHAALEAVRFPYGTEHPTAALSGGESQRLALAGALALDPGVVLLDEPTSMLDPDAAEQLRLAVLEVVRHRGSTLVVVEHRIEPWLDHVDRLVVLDATGAVVADGAPEEVLARQGDALLKQGVWVPGHGAPPLLDVPADLVGPWSPGTPPGDGALVRAHEVSVEHRWRAGAGRPVQRTRALEGVSADLVGGQALAVSGRSGAGKSTLVSVLAGLRRPDAGTVRAAEHLATRRGRAPARWRSVDLARRLSWVPQTPEHGMVASSVADEIRAAARAVGRDAARADRRADGLLQVLELDHLRTHNPHHLSGGEQRRLMLAAALVHGPDAVLLDEPTVGQDRNTWAAVAGCCAALRESGTAVGTSTHDELWLAALADVHLRLDGGREVRR